MRRSWAWHRSVPCASLVDPRSSPASRQLSTGFGAGGASAFPARRRLRACPFAPPGIRRRRHRSRAHRSRFPWHLIRRRTLSLACGLVRVHRVGDACAGPPNYRLYWRRHRSPRRHRRQTRVCQRRSRLTPRRSSLASGLAAGLAAGLAVAAAVRPGDARRAAWSAEAAPATAARPRTVRSRRPLRYRFGHRRHQRWFVRRRPGLCRRDVAVCAPRSVIRWRCRLRQRARHLLWHWAQRRQQDPVAWRLSAPWAPQVQPFAAPSASLVRSFAHAARRPRSLRSFGVSSPSVGARRQTGKDGKSHARSRSGCWDSVRLVPRTRAATVAARRAVCVITHPVRPCPALAVPRPRLPLVGAAGPLVARHLDSSDPAEAAAVAAPRGHICSRA